METKGVQGDGKGKLGSGRNNGTGKTGGRGTTSTDQERDEGLRGPGDLHAEVHTPETGGRSGITEQPSNREQFENPDDKVGVDVPLDIPYLLKREATPR